MRAKLQTARSRLLALLRQGEEACRRLFLDYHGLKLMHSWMHDNHNVEHMLNLAFRMEVLQTLDALPIINKTMLQDSKVLTTVQRWGDIKDYEKFTSSTQAPPTAKPTNAIDDELSPSNSGAATPITNDETASQKAASAGATKPTDSTLPTTVEPVDTASTDDTKTTANVNDPTVVVTAAIQSAATDMLDSIPQILEQNPTIKGMNVDLLKRIISTNEKNAKIIEDAEKLPDGELGALIREICLLASKLVTSWEQLPESFKIPKKLRIEQMKEHEREADQSYKDNTVKEETEQRIQNTYTSGGRFIERTPKDSDTNESREKDPRSRRSSELSKHKRRRLFEAKVCKSSDAIHLKLLLNRFD